MKFKFNFVGALFGSLLFHALFFFIVFYISSLVQRIIPDEKYENIKVILRIPEETLLSGFEGRKNLNSYEGRKSNAKKISTGTQNILKVTERTEPEPAELETKNNDEKNIILENQIFSTTPINFAGNISGYGTGGTGTGSGGFGNGNVALIGNGYGGIGSELGNSGFEDAKKHYKELVTKLIYEKKSYPSLAKKMRAEGEVVVLFSVTPSGEVENIQLKSPCEWEILNNEAIECIRRASPFPKMPFVIKEPLFLSIKIVFELQRG